MPAGNIDSENNEVSVGSPIVITGVKVVGVTRVSTQTPERNWPDEYAFDTICAGDDHLTLNILNDWTSPGDTMAVFDPFSLVDGVLKRLNNLTTEAVQTGVGVSTNTTYRLTLSGAGRVSFEGGVDISWEDASTDNYKDLDTESVTVSWSTRAPSAVKVELLTNTQEVSSINLQPDIGNGTYGTNIILNPDFLQHDSYFYDLVGYWKDEKDELTVPQNAMGWLQGFNEYVLFTIHPS